MTFDYLSTPKMFPRLFEFLLEIKEIFCRLIFYLLGFFDHLGKRQIPKNLIQTLIDNKYADVILISRDKKEIPAHRSVLAADSRIFTSIFEDSTDIPVKIFVEFEAKTILAAMDFLYEKTDDASEDGVFEFACHYSMRKLQVSYIMLF